MSPIFIGPQSSVQPQRVSTPGLGYKTPLLSGEQGTAQTIALMRQLVDAAISDASFVRLASDIVRNVREFDDLGEVESIYRWVKSKIRYTKDPVSKEKLYPPIELLKIRAGDCDDISMLLAALLVAVGHPARWITVSANAQQPDEFSHVYVEAEVPAGSNNWVPMDAARIDAQFGLEPPLYFRKRAWSVTEDSYTDLNGIRRRFPKLNGYVGVSGLGQDLTDWMPVIQQSVAEIPAIIGVSSGRGTAATTPYGSFQTQYSPGYGIPPAGYVAPTAGGGFSFGGSGIMPILLLAGLAVLVLGRRS